MSKYLKLLQFILNPDIEVYVYCIVIFILKCYISRVGERFLDFLRKGNEFLPQTQIFQSLHTSLQPDGVNI